MSTALITCSLSLELNKKMREAKLSPSECLACGIVEKLGQSANREERQTLASRVEKQGKALEMWIKRCRELEEEVILLKAGGKTDGK